MAINERLKRYCDWYLNKNKDITQKELSNQLGLSSSQLSAILNGRDKAGLSVIEKFLTFDENLNANWLLLGRGHMCIEKQIPTVEDTIAVYATAKTKERKISNQLIPIYNIEAAAGLVSLFNDSARFTPMDYISLPNLGRVDGGVYAVGDSMYPLIKSGDIVVYRQLNNIESVLWGEMYLLSYDIEGEEYVVVKYIQKSSDSKFITLASQNQYHQSKDIPKASISALAQIKASVRFNTMRPI